MRSLIEQQIAECRERPDRLSQHLDRYKRVAGIGAAKASSELAACALRLTKLTDDEKLSFGTLKLPGDL